MYKYTQMKMFHHDRWLQVYMYAFMHVDPQPIQADYHFLLQEYLLWNTIKCPILEQSQKKGLDLVTYV